MYLRTLDVLFPARKGPENCEARSRCSVIIWFTGWVSKVMLPVGGHPVWESSSAARVQLSDPPWRTCSWLTGKGRSHAPARVLRSEDTNRTLSSGRSCAYQASLRLLWGVGAWAQCPLRQPMGKGAHRPGREVSAPGAALHVFAPARSCVGTSRIKSPSELPFHIKQQVSIEAFFSLFAFPLWLVAFSTGI